MTLKDIRIWSRSMTYHEILTHVNRCYKNRQFKDAHALNSMLWFNLFARDRPYNKIRDWTYALQEYRHYKDKVFK